MEIPHKDSAELFRCTSVLETYSSWAATPGSVASIHGKDHTLCLATDDERRRWGMIDFKRTIMLKRTLDDPFFWVLLHICNTTACPHARIRSFGTGVIRGI